MINTLTGHKMDAVRTIGDTAATVAAVWTVAGWLPPVAALLSIVWFSMQIVINWDKFVARLKQIANKGQR